MVDRLCSRVTSLGALCLVGAMAFLTGCGGHHCCSSGSTTHSGVTYAEPASDQATDTTYNTSTTSEPMTRQEERQERRESRQMNREARRESRWGD